MNLPINEIFHSIQGEGSFTGMPAVFVRLQFCPISCPWCDTKHTWIKDLAKVISFEEMLSKVEDAPTWADVGVKQLVNYLIQQPEELIVITGGEPCAYDLTELTTLLVEGDKQPQIETSGTFEIKAHDLTFITVSPKINMPGGFLVREGCLHMADEIKMPVGKMADVETLKNVLKHNAFSVPVYVQPLSQSPKATELCIEQARQNGWRLSAQLHKFINVR